MRYTMKKEDKQLLESLKAMTEKLAPYEKYLSMSVHNYLRITPQDTVKLFETNYGPDWKSKVKSTVLTCGTCKLAAVKSIAVEYYSALKTITDIEEKEAARKNTKQENAAK